MADGRRLARTYELYAWSGCLAWVASAVFHTRDVDWTERFDYFGAALTMVVGLWSGLVRVQGWYAPLSHSTKATAAAAAGTKTGALLAPSARRSALLTTLALTAVYVLHVGYLARLPRFDYTYNMRFNVLIALSTILLWSLWTLRQSRLPSPSNFSRRQLSSYPSARARFRAPHHLAALPPLVALPALTALELLDFPPVGPWGLRLLDAHALWHLSTVLVVRAWYAFLVKDVRWIDGQGEGGDPSSVLPASGSAAADGPGARRAGERAAGGVGEAVLAGAALAKRRMTGLGTGLGLGLFGGWESRRGSLAGAEARSSCAAGAGAGEAGDEGTGGEASRGEGKDAT
ncbi:hypothetical protein JCM10207_001837 [Rhodosporidiobolus poonsookiae]